MLSINLLACEEGNFCQKRSSIIVSLFFHRIGEYISLNLFYFIKLTGSCSFIPQGPLNYSRTEHTLKSKYGTLVTLKQNVCAQQESICACHSIDEEKCKSAHKKTSFEHKSSNTTNCSWDVTSQDTLCSAVVRRHLKNVMFTQHAALNKNVFYFIKSLNFNRYQHDFFILFIR